MLEPLELHQNSEEHVTEQVEFDLLAEKAVKDRATPAELVELMSLMKKWNAQVKHRYSNSY